MSTVKTPRSLVSVGGGGIDIDTLRHTSSKTPRSASDVASKKLRRELRDAGESGASKKVGEEREEDLAEFYKKRQMEKLEMIKAAKQKSLLTNPTLSLIECSCEGSHRSEDLTFLLSKGCDLDDEYEGRTPLQAACLYGAQYGVEALIRAGADVDLGNKEFGTTPLMLAVEQGHMGIVTFLLDHSGARPEILDHSGHSALQCAYEHGHASIATKIIRALGQPPSKVTTVAKDRLREQVRKTEEKRKKELAEKKELLERTIREMKEV